MSDSTQGATPTGTVSAEGQTAAGQASGGAGTAPPASAPSVVDGISLEVAKDGLMLCATVGGEVLPSLMLPPDHRMVAVIRESVAHLYKEAASLLPPPAAA